MSCINKDDVKVTMSLTDYEKLESYEKSYMLLRKGIKGLGFIDSSTSDEMIVILKTEAIQDFVVPLLADDCELDEYPSGMTVNWK